MSYALHVCRPSSRCNHSSGSPTSNALKTLGVRVSTAVASEISTCPPLLTRAHSPPQPRRDDAFETLTVEALIDGVLLGNWDSPAQRRWHELLTH
jgi:hypothetical protein